MQSVDPHFKFDKDKALQSPRPCTADAADTISESSLRVEERERGRCEPISESDGLSREEAELRAEYEHLKILKLNIQQ